MKLGPQHLCSMTTIHRLHSDLTSYPMGVRHGRRQADIFSVQDSESRADLLHCPFSSSPLLQSSYFFGLP